MTAPYFQTDFPPEEFAARRRHVFDAMPHEAVAVLQGAAATGAFDRFRQYNEFYYLSGVEVPHAYLLLDGRCRSSVLYLPHCDPKHERSEGAQLHCDDAATAQRLTGVDDVRPLDCLAKDLSDARIAFTIHAPAEGRQACRDVLQHAAKLKSQDPWRAGPGDEQLLRERLAELCPAAEFRDLSTVLDRLRLIKSRREIEMMRRASQLTAQAACEAMRQTRAGMIEYELAATAEYVFLAGGASGGGYRPIVAGGANIWNAHYFRNNCSLRDGDLVLFDYAPDVGCYTSDIGRMWPVNGRYSAQQRELYGFCVEYHKQLIRVIRPGVTIGDLARQAAEQVRPTWKNWSFSKPSYREAALTMIESEVAFTHPVGMAVHDVGEYRGEPLQAGVVFALDPQMWVPDEQLYIRVEDTVVVTEQGVEVLTADAPLELDDIEALMANGAGA